MISQVSGDELVDFVQHDEPHLARPHCGGGWAAAMSAEGGGIASHVGEELAHLLRGSHHEVRPSLDERLSLLMHVECCWRPPCARGCPAARPVQEPCAELGSLVHRGGNDERNRTAVRSGLSGPPVSLSTLRTSCREGITYDAMRSWVGGACAMMSLPRKRKGRRAAGSCLEGQGHI